MNNTHLNILLKFRNFFFQQKITSPSCLLAVSGGVDSIVLCELFSQAGFQFAIAHCNFQLRNEESERDETFVRSLSRKYNVPVYVKVFDTTGFASEKKISIQEAARKLRYEWFRELLNEHGFSHIVTAHHADDNIETLLMNFFRGTGLQGLTAIPAVNEFVIRPMLDVRRKEIIEFANTHHLSWVEDSSNESSKYTRNFFRNELIPGIRKFYPESDNNLLQNIDRFKKINNFYQSAVNKAKKEILEINENEIRIPVRKIKNYDYEVLIYEIIRDFGFGEKQVDEVIRLMDSGSGKFIANEKFQIIRHGNWLVIAPRAYESKMIAIEKGEEKVLFEGGSITLHHQDITAFRLEKSGQTAQLDDKHIEFPLLLRKWKQGDYFYPLGLRKKKKLSRFFIDNKLSKNRKEAVWVIESNKKIVWVVGLRIDDRFKITDSTKSFLTITYEGQRF